LSSFSNQAIGILSAALYLCLVIHLDQAIVKSLGSKPTFCKTIVKLTLADEVWSSAIILVRGKLRVHGSNFFAQLSLNLIQQLDFCQSCAVWMYRNALS
jgi:hypothetical protein